MKKIQIGKKSPSPARLSAQPRSQAASPARGSNAGEPPIPAGNMQTSSEKMARSLTDSLKLFVFFCIAFIVIGVAASILFSGQMPKPSLETHLEEGKLAKNSGLGIREGDSYIYEVATNASRTNVYLEAGLRKGCPGLYVADVTRYGGPDAPDGMDNGVCLGSDGVETGPDGRKMGNNMSFSNLTWPYFQPWMLALDGNFTWEANLSLEVEPYNASQTQEIRWRTLGTGNYSGREGYEVQVQGGNISSNMPVDLGFGLDHPITYLIDKERRVLLFMQEDGVNVSLVRSPFLNATDETGR